MAPDPTLDPAVDPTTVTAAEHEERAVVTARRATPDIDESAMRVGLNLVRASNSLITEAESEMARTVGLSWPSFRVLFITWMYGAVEARSIARIAGVTRQTVSSVLSTVERRGYVQRQKTDESDRRLVTVRLTPLGRDVVQRAFALHNRVESRHLEALSTDERAQLAALLAKVVRHDGNPAAEPAESGGTRAAG